MHLEPGAARTASVAHNPPFDRQASWHQCLTECRRVEDNPSTECAKRVKKKRREQSVLSRAHAKVLHALRQLPAKRALNIHPLAGYLSGRPRDADAKRLLLPHSRMENAAGVNGNNG